jgi:hypothetical protein
MLRDGLKGTKRDATIACRLSLYPLKRNSVNRNPGSSRVSRSIHRLWRRNAGRPPQAEGLPHSALSLFWAMRNESNGPWKDST